MRSVALIWLAALAGCGDASPPKQVVIVDIKGPPPSQMASTTSTAGKALTPALNSPDTGGFKALGTEPFWSLEVLDTKMIYTSPDEQAGMAISIARSFDGTAMHYSGTLQGKPVALTIEPGECSDGMSDQVYSHKARFTWGERTEQGCATRN